MERSGYFILHPDVHTAVIERAGGHCQSFLLGLYFRLLQSQRNGQTAHNFVVLVSG